MSNLDNQVFITKINIEKVRHLHDLEIPVSEDGNMRHLILTGKNGSGKTSLLEALRDHLKTVSTTKKPFDEEAYLKLELQSLNRSKANGDSLDKISIIEERIKSRKKAIADARYGVNLTFNVDEKSLNTYFKQGRFVLAYYDAKRIFVASEPTNIEKVQLKEQYSIDDSPRMQFLKYMLDLKMTQVLALSNGNKEKAQELAAWFDKIQEILRDIYDDPELKLQFDEETYRFIIREKDREPFDFNTASDGFSAVLDIVVDLILRMQEQTKRTISFNKPGIALIDEVENHLHLELQKRVLKYLTELFPNIQFIVTTHSPFVLNSISDAVIYDLENQTLVKNGLSDVSYSGVVDGYFKVDQLSDELRKKFYRYKELTKKSNLSDEDFVEIAELEKYLDEIPDYLALEITTEYSELKLDFHNRKDI